MPDPLTIILFVIFVVLPIINSLVKGRQQPQHPQRPTAPGRQVQRPSAPGPSPAGPARNDDDFTRRLEEARRRVQEAMASDTTSRAPEERPTVYQPPPARDAEFQEAGRYMPPTRSPAPAPSPMTFGTGAQETFSRPRDRAGSQQDLVTAPPLRVQRSSSPKSAKITQESLLRFDTADVYRGILWHQILSEPRSKKPIGRNRSRPRSR